MEIKGVVMYFLLLEGIKNGLLIKDAPPFDIDRNSWSRESLELGGGFYDYLFINEKFFGIRYWFLDDRLIKKSFIFNKFKNDARFHFDWKLKCVDIFNDPMLLTGDGYQIHDVQDFGGEFVVSCGSKFGIVFEVDFHNL